MKRLWVFTIIALMLMVQPVYSPKPQTVNSLNSLADAPPQSIKRIYGENVAADVFSDVSTNEYRDIVMKFTENGSRWIMDYTMATEGTNLEARNYLIQQLELLSNERIEVDIVGTHLNVVGRLPGYLPGEHPAIVVSANYDSAQNSPGANADGSGIAAVLSLARMLSQYEWPLDIYFIAFNGLYTFDYMSGSPEVGNYFQVNNIDILTLYHFDSLLVASPDALPNERILIGHINAGQQGYHNGQYWADLTRMMSSNYGSDYMTTVPSINFPIWETSDHISFFERGFEGLLCITQSGHAVDGSIGTPTDIWNNAEYNYNLGRETTAAVGASIAFTMSRRYGSPTHIEDAFSRASGQFEVIQFAVSTQTIVNISARWFGGNATYYLVAPDYSIISQVDAAFTSPWEAIEIFSQELTTKGTHYFVVGNADYRSVGFEVSLTYNSDIDGNDILDQEEYWLEPSYFESDQDDDGISDAEEIFLGSDMNNSDSDNDSMPDKYELDNGFDPTDASDGNEDADSDGLTNAQEYTGGLDPFSEDSDGDLIDDLWELTYGLNPLSPDDADLDPDGDNMTNLEEYYAGTDPTISDVKTIPMTFYVTPSVFIALIVVILYIRRRNSQMLS